MRIPEPKERKLQFLANRMITRTPEQYKKMSKVLDVWIQGRQKWPMSVCVKIKMFMHNNNINDKNMIAEIKDNRMINIKNKAMNDI